MRKIFIAILLEAFLVAVGVLMEQLMDLNITFVAIAVMALSAIGMAILYYPEAKARWFRKDKPAAHEQVAEREQIISEIKEILDLDAHYKKRAHLDHTQRGRLTVLLTKFKEKGIAPPFGKMPFEMYFGRLLPYIEEYGLDRAKKEINNWYARQARIVLDMKKKDENKTKKTGLEAVSFRNKDED